MNTLCFPKYPAKPPNIVFIKKQAAKHTTTDDYLGSKS